MATGVNFNVLFVILGLSKGVGFIRFDQRHEAERAIKELNGTIPKGYTEPITVKFANNPSNNKAFPPLAAYLTPQTAAAARRFAGPIHHPTSGRFRFVKLCRFSFACKNSLQGFVGLLVGLFINEVIKILGAVTLLTPLVIFIEVSS